MKNLLSKRAGGKKFSGIFGRMLAKHDASKAAANLATNTAAQKNTPAYNAQSAAGVPPSEEERQRRKSTNILTSSDKLG